MTGMDRRRVTDSIITGCFRGDDDDQKLSEEKVTSLDLGKSEYFTRFKKSSQSPAL